MKRNIVQWALGCTMLLLAGCQSIIMGTHGDNAYVLNPQFRWDKGGYVKLVHRCLGEDVYPEYHVYVVSSNTTALLGSQADRRGRASVWMKPGEYVFIVAYFESPRKLPFATTRPPVDIDPAPIIRSECKEGVIPARSI